MRNILLGIALLAASAQAAEPPLRLRSADDRAFRTVLEAAYRQPVNFGHRRVLLTVGCGVACVRVAALDKTSGAVTWLPFTLCCWDAGVAEPVQFRPNNNLLILRGQRNEAGGAGPHYFRLRGTAFVEIPAEELR
ncbi:MAG TPA: hypothetical protein VIT92_10855 [Burkholderiaceae bacterium]